MLTLTIFQRITIAEVKSHPWFVKERPEESASDGLVDPTRDKLCLQSIEEIMQIIQEARTLGNGSNVKEAEEQYCVAAMKECAEQITEIAEQMTLYQPGYQESSGPCRLEYRVYQGY